MSETGDQSGPGLIASVWRYRHRVLAATLVMALFGYAFAARKPDAYTASTRVVLVDPSTSGIFRNERGSVFVEIERYLRNQADMMTSTPVMDRTAADLGEGYSTDDVRSSVSASPSTDSNTVTIHATQGDPQAAADLADAVAAAYQEIVSEKVRSDAERAVEELTATRSDLEDRVAVLEQEIERRPFDEALVNEHRAAADRLTAVEARADEVRIDAALYGAGVEHVEAAEVPTAPSAPKPLRTAAAAGAVGLMAAAAVAFWQAGRHRPEVEVDDVAEILRAPLLARIPDFARSGVHWPAPAASAPRSGVGEAYQAAAAALDFLAADAPVRTLLVTSALPGDGKTATALNVAIALNDAGRSVLLADFDERHQSLTKLYGATGHAGLAELLGPGGAKTPEVGTVTSPGMAGVPLLPAGIAGEIRKTVSLSSGFRELMDQLRGWDVTVIDSPPALAVADTVRMAGLVDAVLVVVGPSSDRPVLEDLRRRLDLTGARVIGYVYNRATTPTSQFDYAFEVPRFAAVKSNGSASTNGNGQGHVGAPSEVPGHSTSG